MATRIGTKSRVNPLIACLILASFVFVGAPDAGASPIVINTVADLQNIQNNLSGNYVLGSNIDASGTANWNGGAGFQPIGSNPFQGGRAFTGTFDGLGHTINGLTINRPSTDIVALFGYVIGYTGGGDVRNVGLTNASIVGGSLVGGLVGYSDTGHTSNVSITGSVRGTDGVGGLIGWGGAYYGYPSLTTSWATSSVTGTSAVGGLVGAGIAIANSYATGTVTGTSFVGGLAGVTGATVSSSYATGAVSGSSNVGGLIGGSGATVTNSYWNTQTSGQPASSGGTGLTTAQLQSGSLPAGFDPSIWKATAGQNPSLIANPQVPSTSPPPDFTQRVSNRWLPPSISGNSISARFSPDLWQLADMSALAHLGGFDHFNIKQDITAIIDGGIPALMPRYTGIDPLLGGNTPFQSDDYFPWYYNEVPVPFGWMPMYNDPLVLLQGPFGALDWGDAPFIGPQNVGVRLVFTDYLVGVYLDHTGVRISDLFPDAQNVNFTWTYTQGYWGGTSGDLIRFGAYDQYEPGSEGSVNFLGYFGSDPNQLSPISASVPEPSTLTLFGTGLLSLFGFAVTRRRSLLRKNDGKHTWPQGSSFLANAHT